MCSEVKLSTANCQSQTSNVNITALERRAREGERGCGGEGVGTGEGETGGRGREHSHINAFSTTRLSKLVLTPRALSLKIRDRGMEDRKKNEGRRYREREGERVLVRWGYKLHFILLLPFNTVVAETVDSWTQTLGH